MNISPTEAEEALAAVQTVAQKTRRAIASGGTYITLIITGFVWLVGFTCTQFLSGHILGLIWGGASIVGSIVSVIWGVRLGRRVRHPGMAATAKRVGFFWLFLILYGVAAILIASPLDGKQITMLIVLFAMIGHLSLGLLLSFSAVWWPLPISVLALAGYFLFPGLFYLWMGILVGGAMIALGVYIRYRW